MLPPTTWGQPQSILAESFAPSRLIVLPICQVSTNRARNQNQTIRPDQLSPQSHSFSLSYGTNLPTSLTYIILSDQRLLTLETWCGYWYGQVRESTLEQDFLRPHPSSAYASFQGPSTEIGIILEPYDFTFTTSPIFEWIDSRDSLKTK